MLSTFALVIALAVAVFAVPLPVETSNSVAVADLHSPISATTVGSSPSLTGSDERSNTRLDSNTVVVPRASKVIDPDYAPLVKTAMADEGSWPTRAPGRGLPKSLTPF
ncbi:hypothetical protein B0A48_05665 [Cryoendolithus antarcticus]|uniref:Uncharacterized protein n=1 Tax=Cryoendolithus antarcticus TaxID=1507870 RepID=A0A1V8TBM5_9PEZI|nr:hypothetical protein B0A48_05665 [Cryoendolithus antarcticus]